MLSPPAWDTFELMSSYLLLSQTDGTCLNGNLSAGYKFGKMLTKHCWS